MDWLQNITLGQFLIFTLVLVRASGLMMIAPIYGSNDVPLRVRAMLAFTLALLITPTQWNVVVRFPQTLPAYVLLLAGELIVGLVLGLGVVILLSGIQLTGQLISRVSGLALANIADPTFGGSSAVFSRLLTLLTLAVFVTTGGHRMVMAALLDTFAALPLGTLGIPRGIGETMVTLLAQSFSLGLRASAPAVTAVLLSTVVLGLIGRTLPQLNILAVGFGLNSMVSLGTLAVSLGAIAWAFQDQLQPALDVVLKTLGGVHVP